MDCPDCQQDMQKLVNDDIADWVCQGCGSLWTDSYLDKLTKEQLMQMHIAWLNTRAFQKKRYEKKPEPEPEKPKTIMEGGLNEWLG